MTSERAQWNEIFGFNVKRSLQTSPECEVQEFELCMLKPLYLESFP
jgi:hypothetical protein